MNLQKYKYRRNFPYNNTIQEDSEENLSENRSTNTFTSLRNKRTTNDALQRQIRKMEFLKGNIDIIKESQTEIVIEGENAFNMKSEKLIRKFEERHSHEASDYNTSSQRRPSERCIRSSDELGSSRQVSARPNGLTQGESARLEKATGAGRTG